MSANEMVEKINRLNPEAKQRVEELIEQLAEVADSNEKKTPSLYGILKGKIWMSPDFDEPLEDFKEYM